MRWRDVYKKILKWMQEHIFFMQNYVAPQKKRIAQGLTPLPKDPFKKRLKYP